MDQAAVTPNRQKVLETIAGEIGRGELVFPSSARLALHIRKVLDDPDCSAATVAKLIQADPLLAGRVVGLANSILFNRSGRPITEVRGAVARVGFAVVRSLVTAIVARQIAGTPLQADHRRMASELWEHTTHVAALAYVLARRVTREDPDTALFAGLMHEVGGFYLFSRAGEFPGLLDGNFLNDWSENVGGDDDGWRQRSFESRIGRVVLDALRVPAPVVEAVETVWHGYLTLPPETLGDTVLLADELAPVKSPFNRPSAAMSTNLDMMVENDTLVAILEEAAGEVEALAKTLKA